MEKHSDIINQVWTVEQEILDIFHKVCLEHHLKYSLAYGTLLGAVRHQGFIPWDDDIDIMMPREDYEKLLHIWNYAAPSQYVLQEYLSDADYTNNFAKIRKDHTTFLQSENECNKKCHKGIFIDIFPGDRVAPGKLSRKIQYCFCAMNLLYSRSFTSGAHGLQGFGERILLKLGKKHKIVLRQWTEKIIKHWNPIDSDYFFACTIDCSKRYYPGNMFEALMQLPFNGKHYFGFLNYDDILRIEYGDYMQLPPEEDRVWKHHPILIDFEHNYEELNH